MGWSVSSTMKQPIESSQVDFKGFWTWQLSSVSGAKVLQKEMERRHTWQQRHVAKNQKFNSLPSAQAIKYRHMDDGQLRLAAAHKCQACKGNVQLGEV